jgi:polyhydroxyalkanoate synthesis regulator protein
MKSALEIAMEKTKAIGDQAREELSKLSPAQRKKIEETKKIYEGKIAERDVLFQQEIMKLTGGVPLEMARAQMPPEAQAPLDDMRDKHNAERQALEKERDGKIEDIKKNA